MGQEMEIVLGDPSIEERTFTSVLEFFRQCKILAHAWAVCAAFKVTFAGKEVYFCHWGEVTAYFTALEDRVLALTTAYQQHSVVNWVAKVEELFRARAIELTRGPEDKVPWGKALLLASQELAERWNQHKDILMLHKGSVWQQPKAMALKDKDETTKGGKSKGKGGAAPSISEIAQVSIRMSVVNGFPWASGKAKNFAAHGTTSMGAIIGALLDVSTGATRSSARAEPRVVRRTIAE